MNEMTVSEFNKMIEILAKLVEAKAKTVEEAVQLIKDTQIR